MPKYALFMSKMLTAKDVCHVSQTMRYLRSQGKEIESVAIMLRQSKTEIHAFHKLTKKVQAS